MLVFFLITWLNIRISLSGCCSWSARLWKRAYFDATWYRENNCLKGLISEKKFCLKKNTSESLEIPQQNFQKYFLKIRILIVQNVIPKQKTGPQGRWKNLEVVKLPLKNYSATIIYITSTMEPSSAWYSVEPKSCQAKPVLSLWRGGGGTRFFIHVDIIFKYHLKNYNAGSYLWYLV